ncbi:hypothetical protein U1Q18_000532 [Sarracenia purpurea var. burkii]
MIWVSGKGSPSPAQRDISGKEGGATGCGFDRKLQRRCSAKTNLVHSSLFACTGKKKGQVIIRCGYFLFSVGFLEIIKKWETYQGRKFSGKGFDSFGHEIRC